jgi:hypothetical protein
MKDKLSPKVFRFILCVAALFLCFAVAIGQETQVPGYELVQKISVPGDSGWTDTGRNVERDEMFSFKASGEILLQKGNPIAFCGPEGYNLITVQQPIKDKNIGACIGKVVQLLSITKDKETGEEVRNELVEYFYIGSGNSVQMPLTGRLFLGINENIVADNSGEFSVLIYLKKN